MWLVMICHIGNLIMILNEEGLSIGKNQKNEHVQICTCLDS